VDGEDDEGGEGNGEVLDGQPVAEPAGPAVAFHEYVVVDSAGRLQIPREFLETMGISDRAEVDLTEQGILVRPASGLADSTAQAVRLAEAAETWGPRGAVRDRRMSVKAAGGGLKRLFRKGDGRNGAGDNT
jgi:bifunctional DNA-binding transcriptional regulator/antitoxin component of YhaV-PrlF toxin-antitoxin module